MVFFYDNYFKKFISYYRYLINLIFHFYYNNGLLDRLAESFILLRLYYKKMIIRYFIINDFFLDILL